MDIFVDDVLRVHTSWTLLFAIIGNITVHRKQKIKKYWRQQHIYKKKYKYVDKTEIALLFGTLHTNRVWLWSWFSIESWSAVASLLFVVCVSFLSFTFLFKFCGFLFWSSWRRKQALRSGGEWRGFVQVYNIPLQIQFYKCTSNFL
jgi:hypothetical protein